MRVIATIACLLCLAFSSPALAAEPGNTLVCEQVVIEGGQPFTGAAIDVSRAEGWFTVSLNQGGTGPVDVFYQVSTNGLDWVTPAAAQVIETSGPGLTVRPFEPIYAPWLRLVVANTGAASVTVTVRCAYR